MPLSVFTHLTVIHFTAGGLEWMEATCKGFPGTGHGVIHGIDHCIDHPEEPGVLVTCGIAYFTLTAGAVKLLLRSWAETNHLSLCSTAQFSKAVFFKIELLYLRRQRRSLLRAQSSPPFVLMSNSVMHCNEPCYSAFAGLN